MNRLTRTLCALAALFIVTGCGVSSPSATAALPEPTAPELSSTPDLAPDVERPEPPAPAPTTQAADELELVESTTADPAPEATTEPAQAPTLVPDSAADDTVLPQDQWPSFRCDAELTEVETFLCTNSQAADADLIFAEFWDGYITERTDHPLLNELVGLQRAWLDYGYRDGCLDPSMNSVLQQSCMRKVYLERQNVLTSARLLPAVDTPGGTLALGWGPYTGTVTLTEASAQTDTQSAIDALVDLAEANLQLTFQSDPRFDSSSGSVDIAIEQAHGQRLSTFRFSTAGFIQPAAHPYFNFQEFLYDRQTQSFIPLSDLLREEHLGDAATVLTDAMVEVALQGGTFDYLRGLSLDELEFAPVFDNDGLIVAFENYARAETLGGYAGRVCFYGLAVPAARLLDYVDEEYTSLFSADRTDGGTQVPDCG